jgi:outer membrane autotransporter protein
VVQNPQTPSLINQFLVYRLTLLTLDDPDRIQFLRRDPGALWGDGGAGSSASGVPLSFAGNSDDQSTQMSFSTSLTRIASAHEAVGKPADASEAMAYAAGAMPFKAKPSVKPESPFDIWIEGRFSQFKAQAADTSSSGSFGIVYAGADYKLSRALMVGVLVQYDWTRDRSQQLVLPASTIEGRGAMAGPYVSGRLSPNLFFDARVAWGLSDNRVNPMGLFQDSFAGNRWLAHGNLVGNWVFGNFRITPSAGVTYASERQSGFIDTLGFAVPSQTVSLGRMSIGPEVAYRFFGANGVMYEPQFSVKGLWDFQRPDVSTVSGIVVGPDAFHARTELALLAKAANGFSLRGAVAYDGVGSSSFHDVSGRLWLNFPLH